VSARAAAAGKPLKTEGRRREIITPEGVPLSLALAERGDRAAAFLIDFVIIAVAVIALALLAYFAGGASLGASGSWTTPFVLVAVFAVRNFYFIFFEIRWRGQTPGKRGVRIRVVDRHGGPLTADMLVARNLMREIEVFLPLAIILVPDQMWPNAPGWARTASSLWAIGLALVPLFNRDRLRIGDLVAGTMVVRAPRAILMPDIGAPAVSLRHAQEVYEFKAEQLDVYGIYELQVLEKVLRDADADPRGQAVAVVSEKIKSKIDWDRSRWAVDDERFLRSFYAALRAHLERKMLFGKRQEDKFSIKK
jgi:uncharacterized RDD family membrane protein YckC